jgi:hypothetical protein
MSKLTKAQEALYKRYTLRDEFKLHLLLASSNFRSKVHPRMKISKKEKLQVFAQITFEKAVSNRTGE